MKLPSESSKRIYAVLLLSLVLGVCSFTVFSYYKFKSLNNMELRTAQMIQQQPKYDAEIMANEGIYQRIKNKTSEEACPQEERALKIFCLEGYHFADYNIWFNNFSGALQKSHGPIEVEVKSFAQAFGLGLTLASRAMTPKEIVITGGPSSFIKYVYDSWGYYRAITAGTEALTEVCGFKEFNNFCLSGVGRAMFFIGFDVAATGESLWAKKGFLFARIYGGGQKPGWGAHRIEKLAYEMRQVESAEKDFAYLCLINEGKHIFECL